MKKLMLKSTCLAIMLFVAGNIFAQEAKKEKAPATQEERTERAVRKLTAELSLTAEQIPQVREIVLTAVKQADADKAEAKGDEKKYKELSEKRWKTKHESLEKILTADQKKKLEEMKKDHNEKDDKQDSD